MLTPKEVREQTFAKAVLGGYDMTAVDEFLDVLTKDYETLYQENDILKEKLRVLVKKLEEYHSNEEAVREVARKCAEMVKNGGNPDAAVAAEDDRAAQARETALQFIDAVENDIRAHLELLEALKKRTGAVKSAESKPAESKAEEPKQPEAYPMTERPTMRFDNLKFGTNYQPEGE